jgi:TetR/AcrR family acrAB operon transcriptional repressor
MVVSSFPPFFCVNGISGGVERSLAFFHFLTQDLSRYLLCGTIYRPLIRKAKGLRVPKKVHPLTRARESEDRVSSTRQRIQEATRRLVARQPLHQLSFAQIAKEAGVSWATVRRYVGEKAHLSEFLAQSQASPESGEGEDTRSRILTAARRVFAHKGYTGASLDEVAADAGLSKGAIYWYFASKSEVLLALVEERRERQSRTLPDAIRRFTESDDPVSALTAVLKEQMELCRQNQEWPLLVVEFLAESREPAVRERFQILTRRRQEIIREAIAEAQQNQRLRADIDPYVVAVLLTSLFDGLQQWSLVDPTALSPASLAPSFAALLWPGLIHHQE